MSDAAEEVHAADVPSEEQEDAPEGAEATEESQIAKGTATTDDPDDHDDDGNDDDDNKEQNEENDENDENDENEENDENDENMEVGAQNGQENHNGEAEEQEDGVGGRRRKKVSRFASYEETEPKERSIPEGRGTPLSEMPNVMANMREVTFSDPHLKMLHMLCLGVGKKREFKANLGKFCGVIFQEGKEEEGREALKAKAAKLGVADLQMVMDIADIERGSQSFGRNPTKEMLVDRLVAWLENPTPSDRNKRKLRMIKGASGEKKKASSAKKSTSKTSAKTSKASGRKRSSPAGSRGDKSKKSKVAEVPETSLSIPGASIEQIRARVTHIVANGDPSAITVKEVRSQLEDWLDADLSNHKDAVRELVMEALQD